MSRDGAVDRLACDGYAELDRINDDFLAGFQCGYAEGIARGRQLQDDELAAIQRRAVKIVHGAAKQLPHAEHRAAVRQRQVDAAARWSA